MDLFILITMSIVALYVLVFIVIFTNVIMLSAYHNIIKPIINLIKEM